VPTFHSRLMDRDAAPGLTFTHTRLLVSDYRACFCFYRDVLGFEVTWGDEESYYANFETGDVTLAVTDKGDTANAVGTTDRPADAVQQDDVALIFRVESVDESYRTLADEIEFVTEPHDRPAWGIRVAHFRDPDGNLVEINRPLEA